jgi:DNA-directed RNA polymerase subunit RPC12/RpoP
MPLLGSVGLLKRRIKHCPFTMRLGNMRYSKMQFFALLLAGLFLLCAGCSERKEAEAMDSDANGYECVHCKAKFYTDRSVFAAKCPSCKKEDVMPMMGFVCSKDGTTMIAPQTAGSVSCSSCKASVIEKKLPRESDFKNWGAVKKTEPEVSL